MLATRWVRHAAPTAALAVLVGCATTPPTSDGGTEDAGADAPPLVDADADARDGDARDGDAGREPVVSWSMRGNFVGDLAGTLRSPRGSDAPAAVGGVGVVLAVDARSPANAPQARLMLSLTTPGFVRPALCAVDAVRDGDAVTLSFPRNQWCRFAEVGGYPHFLDITSGSLRYAGDRMVGTITGTIWEADIPAAYATFIVDAARVGDAPGPVAIEEGLYQGREEATFRPEQDAPALTTTPELAASVVPAGTADGALSILLPVQFGATILHCALRAQHAGVRLTIPAGQSCSVATATRPLTLEWTSAIGSISTGGALSLTLQGTLTVPPPPEGGTAARYAAAVMFQGARR